MGGKGSGRRSYRPGCNGSGKSATGNSLPLDVRALQREGRLRPSVRASWTWYDGEDIPENIIGSITFRAHEGGVTLIYTHQGESVRQTVNVLRTACNYGGSRVWWECPECARRVAIIYGDGTLFACRHCYNLCYFSQQEHPNDRRRRAAWKIRHRLGQTEGGHCHPIPAKPKGMHWNTYSRLHWRCTRLEMLNFAVIATRFDLWSERDALELKKLLRF